MKTFRNIFFLMISTIVVVVESCEPLEKFGDVPEIQFKEYNPYFLYWITSEDTSVISAGDLIFSFVDGNSDFGVYPTSNPADTSNLIFIPYQKEEGIYTAVDAEIYGRKYSIKYDERMDKSGKTVKGDIKVQILFPIPPPFDTIRYDFYIMDRAGNQSNIASTSDIGF